MTRAKVLAALWIIALDLHLGVAVCDRFRLATLLHLDDEFLFAVPASPGLMAAADGYCPSVLLDFMPDFERHFWSSFHNSAWSRWSLHIDL